MFIFMSALGLILILVSALIGVNTTDTFHQIIAIAMFIHGAVLFVLAIEFD